MSKPPDDEIALTRSHAHADSVGISETRWQERPFVTMQLASEIAGVSVASLYRAAEGRQIKLRSLCGRTLVVTASFIEFMNSAPPWSPSKRGKAARAGRAAKRKKT